MFVYPEIDPVAISIGNFQVHWYGIMYMLSFIFLYYMGAWRCRQAGGKPFHPNLMGDYLFYLILGVIIGGRLGHVIFYNPSYYLANPLDIILIYKGGMSFHGGFLGVIVAMILFARKSGASKIGILDLIATDVPIGLMLGRIGNFINGELWGRVTDVPWAMVFEHVDQLPRHPSMLYEAILEGPVLWGAILLYRRYGNMRPGGCAMVFIVGYALARFLVEYVREPESPDDVFHILGTVFTTGQLLSLGMITVVLAVIYWLSRQPAPAPAAAAPVAAPAAKPEPGKRAKKRSRRKSR